jgi:hypothetical protein
VAQHARLAATSRAGGRRPTWGWARTVAEPMSLSKMQKMKTGIDVKTMLNSVWYQSSYMRCPDHPV